ncbi:MAG: DsbE family thiol:disulfide interchange protein [Rhodobacter sp.]|nr:DsbE family thiol:disulfide interchange protein [Rhodobacter sp.]
MPKINPLLVLPPVLLAGFVAFVAVGNFRDDPTAMPSARAGHQAPVVSLEQMGERPLFTDDMLRTGQVTLVNFWASWCPPCRAEHPLVTDLAESGVTILGVNYRDTPERADDYLAELGNPYAAIGADPRARMGLDWGVVGLPETFVVDGDGNIVMRFAGPLTEAVIANQIRPAIERAQGGGS